MIYELNREEQVKLYHRNINNELLFHWIPFLVQLKAEEQELDAFTLLYQTEKVIDELRSIEKHRDDMIPYIYIQLKEDFKEVRMTNGDTIVRTEILAELSAVTVMCVVMTELMNAVQPGHENEKYKNFPICVAIANILSDHPRFLKMLGRFFSKKLDNSGNKIVITPADPMKKDDVVRQMDDQAMKMMESMAQKIINLTARLKAPFGDHWNDWNTFCHEVCQDSEFQDTLDKVIPNRNDWGINQKMICNMVGLFNQELRLKKSTKILNNALSTKNLSSYIRNHADFDGYGSALTRSQHETMKKMLKKYA